MATELGSDSWGAELGSPLAGQYQVGIVRQVCNELYMQDRLEVRLSSNPLERKGGQ